jgi:lysosomal-associated membrane protein 1/2
VSSKGTTLAPLTTTPEADNNATTRHTTIVASAATPTTEPSTMVTLTTPSPTHAPLPPKPWFVNDTDTGIVCILLDAEIQMTFNYTVDDTIKQLQLDVPPNATATGHCGVVGTSEQNIVLAFFDTWHLKFTFALNTTLQKYDLESVLLNGTITEQRFPGANEKTFSEHANVALFDTDDNKKYACKEIQLIYLGPGNATDDIIRIETRQLSFQAFRNSTTTVFSSSENRCTQDTVSQLVPIIVGAALGGLILIVLIAYLIGRKRSRRGYESV